MLKGLVAMVNEGKGRLFRRKDGKYLIYVPLDLAEDSMFPLKTRSSKKIKISFKLGDNKLTIEDWTETSEEQTD
jgi:ribosomal protein L24E